MSGFQVYRDKDGKPAQREWIETVPGSDIATRDADYIRKRLPKEDRIWWEFSHAPQDVPTFNTADLGERREE